MNHRAIIAASAILSLVLIIGWAIFLHSLPTFHNEAPAQSAVCIDGIAELAELNRRMVTMFRQAGLLYPRIINTGTGACNCSSDRLDTAIGKINDNLDRLSPYVVAESP